MKHAFHFLTLFTFSLTLLAGSQAVAQTGRDGLGSKLTEKQKVELRLMMERMRQSGATLEEMKLAMQKKLASWGISIDRKGDLGGFWNKLTPEQSQKLKMMIERMTANGATSDEIKRAVMAALKEWGIDTGKTRIGTSGSAMDFPWWDKLNDRQKTEMTKLIETLRASDASTEKIQAAIDAKLKEWGIVTDRGGLGSNTGGIWTKLTERQQYALKTLIADMKAKGASPERIRAAVTAKLAEWGITPGGVGTDRGGFWNQLTERQKGALETIIKELKTSGASPERIRAAVQAKLKEWGIFPGTGDRGTPQRAITDPFVKDIQNFPNPFNPSTTISYALATEQYVTVRVFNSNGQLVRTLIDGKQSNGTNLVTWDGRDESNVQVASGVYLLRIDAGAFSETHRMILSK